MQSGQLDVIDSGMEINTARASSAIWFSIPYYTLTNLVVSKASDNRSISDLLNSGGYVACVTGGSSETEVDNLLSEGYHFQKLGLSDAVSSTQAVLDGRAVAYVTDSGYFIPYQRTNPAQASELRIVSTVGPSVYYAIATRPGDTWLRTQINTALTALMASPTWDQLLQKWNV